MPLSDIRLGHLRRPQHRRAVTAARDRSRPARRRCAELHYGRIILDAGDAALDGRSRATFETGPDLPQRRGHDRGGRRDVRRSRRTTRSTCRATRRSTITAGAPGCDLAEIAARSHSAYPLQFVRFADVQKDPGLHFNAGGAASERDAEHPDRQERRGRPHHGRRHVQRSPATGRRGRRTSTARCSKRRISTSTCRRPRSACSWSTRTRASRSSRRSCAKATSC